MADGQNRKPVFWPVVFIGAFATGALLWGVWMVVLVNKTKRIRPDDFYAPLSHAATNAVSNGPAGMTNFSGASSNSAATNGK